MVNQTTQFHDCKHFAHQRKSDTTNYAGQCFYKMGRCGEPSLQGPIRIILFPYYVYLDTTIIIDKVHEVLP